ncbi:hypothetical protein PN460_10990 [Nodularia sphaerocarpa CS-585A2]|nr:hypothetical protein [Nodularia sphaerocarpa CS-585A2]
MSKSILIKVNLILIQLCTTREGTEETKTQVKSPQQLSHGHCSVSTPLKNIMNSEWGIEIWFFSSPHLPSRGGISRVST